MEVKHESGATIVRYEIDAQGRRISEDVGDGVRQFFYSNAWQLLEERVDGDVVSQYVWSPLYVDAMVLRDRDTDANGTLDERLYVVQDANFNVTALVDVNGDVIERFAYDPYGVATVYDASWTEKSGSDFAWQYLHQGLRFEEETGLYHNRMREYSATLMRFVSVDPLGSQTGANLYFYVANNPVVFADPTGEWFFVIVAAIAVGGMLLGPPAAQAPALGDPHFVVPPAAQAQAHLDLMSLGRAARLLRLGEQAAGGVRLSWWERLSRSQPVPQPEIPPPRPILVGGNQPLPGTRGNLAFPLPGPRPGFNSQPQPLPQPDSCPQTLPQVKTREECYEDYESDVRRCQRTYANPRARRACYERAANRYSHCLGGEDPRPALVPEEDEP